MDHSLTPERVWLVLPGDTGARVSTPGTCLLDQGRYDTLN